MSGNMNTPSAAALTKAGYTLSTEGRFLRAKKGTRFIEAELHPEHHTAERIWAAIAAEVGIAA